MNASLRPVTLVLLAAALPLLAHGACQVESAEMPVKMVGSRAVATVGINGTPVPLTVDSGAFFSMLTDAAAEQLKLGTRQAWGLRVEGVTGRVETRLTKVEKLQLFKGEIDGVEFIVGGNEPGAGTMGLMGRNLLAFTDTEYDLANGVIRFHFPGEGCAGADMAYWAGATPVTEVELLAAKREKTPAIRARVKLNGVELVALLDTGAHTIVTTRGAARAGVKEADMTPAGTVFGAGRGSAKSWLAGFDTFELAGETVRNNRLHVSNFELGDADLLLGIDFFLSHRIYVSKSQSKMFITYNGGTVFALNRGPDDSRRPSEAGPAAGSAGEAESADRYARRGAASAARRDYERALDDLNRACELEPTSAPYFAQRAAVHEALKRPAKALEDFDKALQLDPALADARMRRASLRMRVENPSGAKDDLDALDSALAPQAQARLFMANLYLGLAQPAQAIAQFSQWLPSHPNDVSRASALNGRCWARVRLGIDLDKALDDCDEAIDIAPKNAAYRDSRGWVHLRLGNLRKALADFDRSLDLRPDGAWSLYGRALAKARASDAGQGESDLAAARKLMATIDADVMRAGLPTAADPRR